EKRPGRRGAARALPAPPGSLPVRPILYPAIDLLGGRAVRLRHGDRRSAKAYSEDPPAQARAFVAQGAQALHVVDLDAAFGEATRGWTGTGGSSPERLAALFAGMGVSWLIVTAVARDGTMEGFDLQLLREVALSAPAANLIASGGAGSLSHLKALAAAGVPGLAGAIAGTALYEDRFTIREAQAALDASGERAGC